jgi:hypothetical protein
VKTLAHMLSSCQGFPDIKPCSSNISRTRQPNRWRVFSNARRFVCRGLCSNPSRNYARGSITSRFCFLLEIGQIAYRSTLLAHTERGERFARLEYDPSELQLSLTKFFPNFASITETDRLRITDLFLRRIRRDLSSGQRWTGIDDPARVEFAERKSSDASPYFRTPEVDPFAIVSVPVDLLPFFSSPHPPDPVSRAALRARLLVEDPYVLRLCEFAETLEHGTGSAVESSVLSLYHFLDRLGPLPCISSNVYNGITRPFFDDKTRERALDQCVEVIERGDPLLLKFAYGRQSSLDSVTDENIDPQRIAKESRLETATRRSITILYGMWVTQMHFC